MEIDHGGGKVGVSHPGMPGLHGADIDPAFQEVGGDLPRDYYGLDY